MNEISTKSTRQMNMSLSAIFKAKLPDSMPYLRTAALIKRAFCLYLTELLVRLPWKLKISIWHSNSRDHVKCHYADFQKNFITEKNAHINNHDLLNGLIVCKKENFTLLVVCFRCGSFGMIGVWGLAGLCIFDVYAFRKCLKWALVTYSVSLIRKGEVVSRPSLFT